MAALSDQEAHVLANKPVTAELSRCDSEKYRGNGLSYLGGNAGRKNGVYNNDAKIIPYLDQHGIDPDPPGPKPASPQHARRYHLFNFKAKGAGSPYPNIGHHLVPSESFSDPPDGAFTAEEREILLRTKYKLNKGHNIIFLPGFSSGAEVQSLAERKGTVAAGLDSAAKKKMLRDRTRATYRHCNVHKLPCHIDFHADYNRTVARDLKSVRDLLRSQLGKICEEWDPPASIDREIWNLEEDYWSYVVRYGESLSRGGHIKRLVKAAVRARERLQP